MSKRQVARVAFGFPEAPFSQDWRFWTQGDDVYASARRPGGIFKLSLHASGVWKAGATRESGITEEGSDLPFRSWTGRRPAPLAPGWVLSPGIMVAGIDEQQELPYPPREEVTYLRAPPVGSAAWLHLIFSEHGDASPEAVMSDPLEIVHSFDLNRGERVWLTHIEARLGETGLEWLREQRDLVRIDVKPRAGIAPADFSMFSASAIIPRDPDAAGRPGAAVYVEVVLGSGSFVRGEGAAP